MSTEFEPLYKAHLSEHLDAIGKLCRMSEEIAPLADAWLAALKAGKKILFFGNGGSAADAQHLAAELVVRYRVNRPALAGLALTTDTSILTAHSNDFGYDTVFARQIEALAQPGDVVLGISTSGTSKNVLLGLQAANKRGCVTIAFTGEKGADCAAEAKLSFKAPSGITARVQECHLLIGHLLCDVVEKAYAVA
ncbi:D-sedoheptulose 7-phosphate isomerase [Prosthecobacter sp.]|uniref:D-sedoheptulose 7-phosphate isomerase n=1 Tax=Prosthecobacter sp. TaxID=1965333 RepID=UPI003783503C